MREYFIHYFKKNLKSLKAEIESYDQEEQLWIVSGDINNSAGNLCCHLIGNLNHYIGAAIGQTGYERDRPLEFSIRGVPRDKLLQQIDETIDMVKTTLEGQHDLEQPYPEAYFGVPGSTAFFLFRLLGHLNYHLGQINYHRRLLAAKEPAESAQTPPA